MVRSLLPAEQSTHPLIPTLAADEWDYVVQTLKLTRQQACIVALILKAKRDKQIANALGVREPTVRTHLRMVFARNHLSDRTELVLHVWGLLRQRHEAESIHPS